MSRERFYRFGLLGRNISYSLSPRIHQWALVETGQRGEYVLHDADISRACGLVRSQAWDGLNVTIPHKSAIIECCDSLTDAARRAHSVNMLFRRDGEIVGDSRDGVGFLFALRELAGEQSSFERVLVIGGGGAARAILAALLDSCVTSDISVAVRNPQRACRDCANLLAEDARLEIISLEHAAEILPAFEMIVQATPSEFPLPSPLRFKRNACVMDLMYSPRKTEFLRIAQKQGARVQNGLPMLIGQAAVSFEMWTGEIFPRERAMRELLPELESA